MNLIRILQKKNKKSEGGYTLIELIITIFIVGIILTTASLMLVTLIKTTQKVDTRRTIRQDLEQSLDVLKRDIRNADPELSLTECDPKTQYTLLTTSPVKGIPPTNNKLSIVLITGQANVTYSVEKDKTNNIYSLKRAYVKNNQTVNTYLTSNEVDLKSLTIDCSKLLKENKFLLIKIVADSTSADNNGKIVKDLKRVTGTTIRNVNNN